MQQVILHVEGAQSALRNFLRPDLKGVISPLLYVQDGERLAIIASKGGHPRHPAWFHNLRANPDTTVQVGSRKVPVTARVATDAERKRLWPEVVKAYSGYEGYQRRTERKIPLVVLEPR